MRQMASTGRTLLALLGTLTSCATSESAPADEPTVGDFCSVVARAPKDDVSLEETRVAAAAVEKIAPPEVRGEVTTMREAVDKVSTVKEVEALIDQQAWFKRVAIGITPTSRSTASSTDQAGEPLALPAACSERSPGPAEVKALRTTVARVRFIALRLPKRRR